MTHHKTWFPVVVASLTVLLGLFIYSVFQSRLQISTAPAAPVVTAVEYQAQVHAIVGLMRKDVLAAADDQIRLEILSADRDRLLTLFVPAEYKDVHLELVMVLSQWIAGYQGQQEKVPAAQLRFQAIVDQYSWIE